MALFSQRDADTATDSNAVVVVLADPTGATTAAPTVATPTIAAAAAAPTTTAAVRSAGAAPTTAAAAPPTAAAAPTTSVAAPVAAATPIATTAAAATSAATTARAQAYLASQPTGDLTTLSAASTTTSIADLAGSGASGGPTIGESAASFCSSEQEKDTSIVEADVLIVGTGLVGCLTAAALARRDLKVVQIDGNQTYGGVNKSIKLSELCDWVKAENHEKEDRLPWCHRQTATRYNRAAPDTPVTAPAARGPANSAVTAAAAAVAALASATEATGSQTYTAKSGKLKRAAGTGAAVGEIDAAVLSSRAAAVEPASAQAFTEGVFTVEQVTPAVSSGSSERKQQHKKTTAKRRRPFGESSAEATEAEAGVAAKTTGDFLSPLQSSCFACAASSAEGTDYGSPGDTSFCECSEWVCCLEENERDASFCLRRQRQGPSPTSVAQANAAKCPNSLNAEEKYEQQKYEKQKNEQQNYSSSSSLAPCIPHNPLETSAAAASAWGGSEHVFYSSRCFLFFPFATNKAANMLTHCNNSINAAKRTSTMQSRSLHTEEDEHVQLNGGETETSISAAVFTDQAPPKSVATTTSATGLGCCSAGVEAAVCVDAAASEELGRDSQVGFDRTDALSRRGVSSEESRPTPGSNHSCGISAVDDKEALIERLLKSRSFNIDLFPRILYSNSSITHILVTCGAAKYLEFRPVDAAVYLGELDAAAISNKPLRTYPTEQQQQQPQQYQCGLQDGKPERKQQPHHEHHDASAGKRERGAASADYPSPPQASAVSESNCRVHDGATGTQQESGTGRCCPSESTTRSRLPSWLPLLSSADSDKKASYLLKEHRGHPRGDPNEEDAVSNRCPMKWSEGNNDECVEKDFDLTQMPLTRGAIFASSLLTAQEKRLLMKFLKDVAAPKLNNQFLSAARLWTSPGPMGGLLSRETGNEATNNREDTVHNSNSNNSNNNTVCQQGSVSESGGKLEDDDDGMSWVTYLQSHRLTEKLQRYLSYGVCVSEFPLRRCGTSLHNREYGARRSAGAALEEETGVTRGEEGSRVEQDKMKMMKYKNESNGVCCVNGSWKASEGYSRLVNFLQSIGLYENHLGAWLYPIYGTGDVPQALARAASLSGAVYMLRADLVELRCVCPLSFLLAPSSSSCFTPSRCCCMPSESSYTSSALSTEKHELRPTTLGGTGEVVAASENQYEDRYTVCSSNGIKQGNRGFCFDGCTSFLSKLHTAMASAEAFLEAKLQTGMTVRTRVVLFEADAMPPLYERVRMHKTSKAVSHADRGCTLEAGSKCCVSNCESPVGVSAQCSMWTGAPPRSEDDAVLKDYMQARRLSSSAATDSADIVVGRTGSDGNLSSQALSTQAAAANHRVHEVEAWKKRRLSPHTACGRVQSTVCLGELLFPVLGLHKMPSIPVPYIASKGRKDKRGECTTVEENTAQIMKQNLATPEKEEAPSSLWNNRSPTKETTCIDREQRRQVVAVPPPVCAVHKPCHPEQTTHREAGDGHSNRPRSRCDYYTQASCHLIALCSRSVLNGPGFRMCVCTVRSEKTSTAKTSTVKTSTVLNSTGVASNDWRTSTVRGLRFSGCTSVVEPKDVLKPVDTANESADLTAGGGRGDEARNVDSAQNAVGVYSSPSGVRPGHVASGVPTVALKTNAAHQTSDTDTTLAWPVLVLQTDGTCGTTPADYVLLHLSHIDGVGVDACGCSCREQLLRKSSDSKEKNILRSSVLPHKEYASSVAAGTDKHFHMYEDRRDIPNFSRCEAALTPAARTAPPSSATNTGVVETNALRSGHVGHACCKNSTSRPCEMLMYVLRRLLERGRHRGAAGQDCVFVCGYISHTLRSDVQKQLQAWQRTHFRGVLRKKNKNLDVAGDARQRRSSVGKQNSAEEGIHSIVRNKRGSGSPCPKDDEAAPDAAGASTTAASSLDGDLLDVPQQSSVASLCVVNNEASRVAEERRHSSQACKKISSDHITSEDKGECNGGAAVGQCGCLLLPAAPSTPLWFLLQEPKASQQILEVLLDQQVDVADLVPAHLAHDEEVSAGELQRLSAPYERLSEIVARVL